MNKNILVVDDEETIREVLTEAFTAYGYRVTSAASAVEAQKAVRNDPPQLVISDLQLEDSDGLAMIDELKQILPNTPMMLLTGVLFDSRAESVLLKKVSCYLPKTSPMKKILEEVQRQIGPP